MATLFEDRVAAHRPPPGFRPLQGLRGLVEDNGPVFAKREDDGSMVFGCRILPNMCNPMDVAHGGWIATLCDVSLPLAARLSLPDCVQNFLLTVNLSVDYLAGAKLGEWVECRARILKRTKRLLFIDGLLTVDGAPVARASGVFRIGPEGTDVIF